MIKRTCGKPIIVGVSAPGFAAMRSLSRKVMDMGAAGVMIAPGTGLKTDDQISAYFRNAMDAIGSDIPWVLQDYPQSTGVTMSNTMVKRVVMEMSRHPLGAACVVSPDHALFGLITDGDLRRKLREAAR